MIDFYSLGCLLSESAGLWSPLGFKKKWVKSEMAAGSHFEKNKTTKNLVIKCDMSFLTNFGRLRRAHLWP